MVGKSVWISEPDTHHFGIRIARSEEVTLANIDTILAFCHSESVKLLIARCDGAEIQTPQIMQEAGFRLMSTIICYEFDYQRQTIPQSADNITIRPVTAGDEKDIENIARDVFQNFQSHYHANSALDKKKSDEVYVSWAVRSCLSRDVVDHMLIAELDGQPAGFITLQMNSDHEGEAVLSGVSSRFQRRGIYHSLMTQGLQWGYEQSAQRMIVCTPLGNFPVHKVCGSIGFIWSHSHYTFHKWFDT